MGKSSGISSDVQQGMLSNETALVGLAQQQSKNAQQLYNLTEPGLATAENFYSTLSTGDPGAIARATAPAVQQITEATNSAKKNIMDNAPAGGEKNLALEQADVARGAEVGKAASGSYLNSFNALAQLAGQGVGESISAAGTGISGYNAASNTLSSLGGMQLQSQQIQAQEKGATLGALGSLGGGLAEGAGQAGGFAALFA